MSATPATALFRVLLSGCLLFGAGAAAGIAVWESRAVPPPTPNSVFVEPPATPPITTPTPLAPKIVSLRAGIEATIEPTPDGLFWATPRLVGRDVRFLVQPGQIVRQDTPLLVQDHAGANPKELAEQERREALLNLTIAKRRCDLAERELQRAIQAKLTANAIDRLRVDLQVTKDRCEAATEQVKKAQLHEELAEFEKNLKIVESPFAGIVLKVEGARGQTTPNGVGVCVLNPAIVQVPCVLPAALAKDLSLNATVTVNPVGQPSTYTAKITGKTPRLLPGNKFDDKAWTLWLEVRNPENDPALYPGQRVLVCFPEARE